MLTRLEAEDRAAKIWPGRNSTPATTPREDGGWDILVDGALHIIDGNGHPTCHQACKAAEDKLGRPSESAPQALPRDRKSAARRLIAAHERVKEQRTLLAQAAVAYQEAARDFCQTVNGQEASGQPFVYGSWVISVATDWTDSPEPVVLTEVQQL